MRLRLDDMIDYKPAQFKEGSRSYIEFYCKDPINGELQRIRKYLNHIKPVSVRRQYARQLVASINNKLSAGWNPLRENLSQHLGKTLEQSLNDFRRIHLQKLRHRSRLDYSSKLNILMDQLARQKLTTLPACDLTQQMAQQLMDAIHQDRQFGPNTYNNYLKDFNVIFNWLNERDYIESNPFAKLKRMKKERKKRLPMLPRQLSLYSQYLHDKDPDFLLPSMLLYYAAIRPVEQTGLKVGDIDLHNGTIRVRSDVAKNGHERIIEMATPLWQLTKAWIKGYPDSHYLITKAGKRFIPGENKVHRNRLSERFASIRKKLDFPDSITFYSLKDTIADQLDKSGVPLKDISKFFDHQSTTVTSTYMGNFEPVVRREMLSGIVGL